VRSLQTAVDHMSWKPKSLHFYFYLPSISFHLHSLISTIMSDPATEKPTPVRRSTFHDEEKVNKLDNALSHRPDKQDLVARNILKDDRVAPALQAAKEQLERAQLEDKIDQSLQHRPTPEVLVKKGILQVDEVPPS